MVLKILNADNYFFSSYFQEQRNKKQKMLHWPCKQTNYQIFTVITKAHIPLSEKVSDIYIEYRFDLKTVLIQSLSFLIASLC